MTETSSIELRHFAIQTKLNAKKKITNLLSNNKNLPNLGKYQSIEEYMYAKSGSGLVILLERDGKRQIISGQLKSVRYRDNFLNQRLLSCAG